MPQRERTAEHLSDEELAAYLQGQASPEREGSIEEHLSGCDDCVLRARETRAFLGLWTRWTAREHGAAAAHARVATALARAAERAGHPAWRERLSRWRTAWGGRAEAAVQVIVGEAARRSRVITEGLEALARPGSAWQFAPQAALPRVRAPEAATLPEATIALTQGSPRVQVVVGEGAHQVVVRLDAGAPGALPPLVLLVPLAADADAVVAQFEPVEGTSQWIARFAAVSPGEYWVLFEPPAA